MADFSLDLHLVTDRSLSCGRQLLEIVRAAVAGGVTVVSAICAADDPTEATRALRRQIDVARDQD